MEHGAGMLGHRGDEPGAGFALLTAPEGGRGSAWYTNASFIESVFHHPTGAQRTNPLA
jgi:hypothetical protein